MWMAVCGQLYVDGLRQLMVGVCWVKGGRACNLLNVNRVQRAAFGVLLCYVVLQKFTE